MVFLRADPPPLNRTGEADFSEAFATVFFYQQRPDITSGGNTDELQDGAQHLLVY